MDDGSTGSVAAKMARVLRRPVGLLLQLEHGWCRYSGLRTLRGPVRGLGVGLWRLRRLGGPVVILGRSSSLAVSGPVWLYPVILWSTWSGAGRLKDPVVL